MTYETIEWEAEAKHLAAGFRVERECNFRKSGSGFKLYSKDGEPLPPSDLVPLKNFI
jgi:hypothetical protein